MSEIDWFELLICILFASFGGVVKKLVDMEKSGGKSKKAGIGQYISSSVISLFAGMVIYFIAKHYTLPIYLTMSLTSVTGFAGAPALYLVVDQAVKKFVKKMAVDKPNKITEIEEKGEGE